MATIEQQLKEGCDILLQAATPYIYHINAFRISGLNVSATTREITNQVQKNQMFEKYGGKMDNHKSPFPIEPPPNVDKLRQALHRLRDPETRIIDEFFWFWPHSIDSEVKDHALDALSRSDIKTAESLWINYEATLTESNVSRHNLAILSHLLVLDIELNGNSLTKDKSAIRDKYWKDTFKRWTLLIEHEGFWSRLTARVRQMDDPRLTTGFVKRMRESLPYAILQINASLALKAAEAGDKSEVVRQIDLMNNSGFGKDVVSHALKHVVNPLRARIKVICKSYAEETYTDPKSELAACWRLIEQTKEILNSIDILLPDNNTIKEGAHDEVVLTIIPMAISYSNKSKDDESCIPIFEQLQKIVIGVSAKNRVEKNYEIFKSNIEYDRLHNTCFFCQKNKGDEKSKVKVSMHGNIRRVHEIGGVDIPVTGTYSYLPIYTKWSYNTFEVPRCVECEQEHKKHEKQKVIIYIVGFIFALVFGIIIGIFTASDDDGIVSGLFYVAIFTMVGYWPGYLLSFIMLKFIFFINTAILPSSKRKIKQFSYHKEFPAIKLKLKEGWTWGERPSEN